MNHPQKKTVSVLVPAYNAEQYIADTLDSVAAQTRLPDAVVVVDDGSGDATAQRVETWSREHSEPPVVLIRQPNQGVAAARNTGIKAADTDLIALLDSDDLMRTDHLELLLEPFEVVEDMVIAFGDQAVFSEHGLIQEGFFGGKRLNGVAVEKLNDDVLLLREPAYLSLIWGDYIPTSGCVLSRQAIISAGLYDTGLATSEDRDLLLRVSRLGEVAYSHQVVADKREHEHNLTHSRNDLRTVANAFRVVAKQWRNADALKLNQAELRETRIALDSMAESWVYAASINGFGEWLKIRPELAEMGYTRLWLNPRAWLRSVYYSLAFLLGRRDHD